MEALGGALGNGFVVAALAALVVVDRLLLRGRRAGSGTASATRPRSLPRVDPVLVPAATGRASTEATATADQRGRQGATRPPAPTPGRHLDAAA